MTRWQRYVAFWNEKESPDALALLRITLGLAFAGNILEQMIRGDVIEFYAEIAHGGIFGFQYNTSLYSLFHYVPTSRGWVWGVVLAQLLASLTFTVGLFTRLSAIALFVTQMTLFDRMTLFRFGADEVYRVASYLMVLAPMGASFSLDAAWRGKGRAEVGKWARRLFMAQLAIIYVRTGVVKLGSTWSIMGDWAAVYLSVNLPGIARWPGDWAASRLVYPMTQLGTFVFSWWEFTFFLLPINQFLRRKPAQKRARKQFVRRALARFDLRPLYLGLGMCMHLGIFISMDIGLFAIVMWSLYPAYILPQEARRALTVLFGWVRSPRRDEVPAEG
ncbi:MAG TPA: HTTM domain-containing protein [Polyangiaceae bacterium]